MSPAVYLRKPLVLLGLAVALASAVAGPQGTEYAISGPLGGDQTAPAVAIGPEGGWVTWQDNSLNHNGTLSVMARRLDANLNPLGAPFRVNHGTSGDQEKPQVALLPNGGAAVVWLGGKLGFQNVYLRILNADGSFATGDVLVSESTGKHMSAITTNVTVIRNNKLRNRLQRLRETVSAQVERTGGASVAVLSDGNIAVSYASARKVNRSAQVLTERVRQVGRRYVTNTVVTAVPVVQDSMQDVYVQRFTAAGGKVGGEIFANQFTPFNQRNPSVAARADGTFVVAWVSELQGQVNGDPVVAEFRVRGALSAASVEHQLDVVARLFGNNGAPVGDEFVVNTSTQPCSTPSVAASSGGGFTIAWVQTDPSPVNRLDVYARAYSPAGNAVTDGFLVNVYQRRDQHSPKIAAMPSGQLVVWTSVNQDGSREGVYGRWLNDGTISSDEFRVNTTTLSQQLQPAVAADAGNRALVIWSSFQTAAGLDLFGQRYSGQ